MENLVTLPDNNVSRETVTLVGKREDYTTYSLSLITLIPCSVKTNCTSSE